MSFDIYAHRSGGTDAATIEPILELVEPYVVRSALALPHDDVPRLQVRDLDGGVATAYAGDPREWGSGDHLIITYNRPTPPRSIALLGLIHRIATLGQQTLCVPYGYPVVTTEAAREHAAPEEADAPLVRTAEELLAYWIGSGSI